MVVGGDGGGSSGIDRAGNWRQQKQHRSLQVESNAIDNIKHGPRHLSACSPPLNTHSTIDGTFYQVLLS